MTTKNSDNVTLKNITGKPDSLYVLDAVKPQIEAIPRSNVLQKIHGFLPRIKEANKDLSNIPTMQFEVIKCAESSSEDSDTSSDEDDEAIEEESEQLPECSSPSNMVQMNIDLFKSKDEVVTNDNIEAQVVDEVPLAFREAVKVLEEPKKKTIEVLDD